MKKVLFRSTIIILAFFTCYIVLFPIGIYIKEINLDLWRRLLPAAFVFSTMIWLSSFSYSRDCKNGGLIEMLFYILPIEILLLLVFAQRHFYIAVALIAMASVTVCVSRLKLRKDMAHNMPSRRELRRSLIIRRRITVLVLAAFLAVPSMVSVFVYNLESPRYESKQDLWEEIYNADVTETGTSGLSNPFESNPQFLLCFSKETWEDYSTEEKITILQGLVDWEACRLGMPTVRISAERLNPYTLGRHSRITDEITIDLAHIDQDPVNEVLNTCLHETYHAFQAYVVANIDWTSEFVATNYYFLEARAWKDNYSNYIYGIRDYNAYAEQPLEAAANTFAEAESLLIWDYIENNS